MSTSVIMLQEDNNGSMLESPASCTHAQSLSGVPSHQIPVCIYTSSVVDLLIGSVLLQRGLQRNKAVRETDFSGVTDSGPPHEPRADAQYHEYTSNRKNS